MSLSNYRTLRSAVAAAGIIALAGGAAGFNPVAGDFSKPAGNLVRVLTWNVHNSFIYESTEDAKYARIIKAINPDVIAMQEIDVSLTENQIINRLQSYFPGTTWHCQLGKADGGNEGVSNRNIIVSRFPLSMRRTDTAPTSAIRGICCALVDLPNAQFNRDLYMMSIHFKAGGTDADHEMRQVSSDAVINWMRDARNSGGTINLPAGTPMMTTGDFNFGQNGDRSPWFPTQTMLEGTIFDTGKYGNSSAPDWDGTDNADAGPYDYNTGSPATHSSSNPQGRIDRYYYTDSVMRTVTKFVFNTRTMTAAARTAAGGLQTNDTSSLSDHLPIVADFALGADTPGQLLVNEYLANDLGSDDRNFMELINTSGGEINLDAPQDYWIKTSLPLTTTVPSTTNEEFAYDLTGVVPPNGGLYVLYDGAGESSFYKNTIEANLGPLNRQDLTNLMLRNQDYSAYALVTRVVKPAFNTETNVEAYGYGAPDPNTTRYFKVDANGPVITLGPNQWTNHNAGEVGLDTSLSRNGGNVTPNSYVGWTIGTNPTPGLPNGISAVGDWSIY